MAKTQSIIRIPESLASEIDKLAGPKRRSAYAIDVLWREVQRNRQSAALRASKGAWKAEDHPEPEEGGAAYVEKIRSEQDERFEAAISRQER
jgi:hypothetical protein